MLSSSTGDRRLGRCRHGRRVHPGRSPTHRTARRLVRAGEASDPIRARLALTAIRRLKVIDTGAAELEREIGELVEASGVSRLRAVCGVGPITSLHANWINICNDPGCDEHVQTGTIQGCWNGGCSQGTVLVFSETQDLCGDYYPNMWSAPPSPDYPYYLSYDGLGKRNVYCNNGAVKQGYYFMYRKDSVNSNPFDQGALNVSAGYVEAGTEMNPQSTTLGTDRYGCDPNLVCSNQSYGMHLYNGSTWLIWTPANAASHLAESKPPYVHTISNYWTYSTCPVAC